MGGDGTVRMICWLVLSMGLLGSPVNLKLDASDVSAPPRESGCASKGGNVEVGGPGWSRPCAPPVPSMPGCAAVVFRPGGKPGRLEVVGAGLWLLEYRANWSPPNWAPCAP